MKKAALNIRNNNSYSMKKKKDYLKPKLTTYGSLKDITSTVTCDCDKKCFTKCLPDSYPGGGICPRTDPP
jgi:hypothetical protein